MTFRTCLQICRGIVGRTWSRTLFLSPYDRPSVFLKIYRKILVKSIFRYINIHIV
jgi:hypothetical protein